MCMDEIIDSSLRTRSLSKGEGPRVLPGATFLTFKDQPTILEGQVIIPAISTKVLSTLPESITWGNHATGTWTFHILHCLL